MNISETREDPGFGWDIFRFHKQVQGTHEFWLSPPINWQTKYSQHCGLDLTLTPSLSTIKFIFSLREGSKLHVYVLFLSAKIKKDSEIVNNRNGVLINILRKFKTLVEA